MRAVIAGFVLGLVVAGCGGLLLLHFWHQHRPVTHAVSTPPVVATPEAISIPRCDGLTPDGNAATWGQQGFRLNVLQDIGDVPENVPPARAFLAWNGNAFLVRVEVDVTTTIEAERDDQLWRDDSIELFLTAGAHLEQTSQVVVAPGLDPRHPAPRQVIGQNPAASPKPFPVQIITRRTSTGYAVEFVLPWSAYGITPDVGQKVAIQVLVHHRDDNGLRSFGWYPGGAASSDPAQKITVVLGQTASPPINTLARFAVLNSNTIQASATYSPDACGHVLFLQYRDEPLGRFRLGDDGSFTTANFQLPADWRGPEPIVLRDGTQFLNSLAFDEVQAQIKKLASPLDYAFSPSIFDGTNFPHGGFAQDAIVRRFFAPVEVHTKFYDAQYNEVTQAAKPGRYGAIVHIRLADGVDITRYVTLYRTPEKTHWFSDSASGAFRLPAGVGINPVVQRIQQDEISRAFRYVFMDGFNTSNALAVLLAGLSETKASDPTAVHRTDVWARDADWWYALREKIGQPEKYEYLLDLPTGYDANSTQKWPLILFLHGSGERGDHVEDVRRHGLAQLIGQGRQFPAIVVSPQCPDGEWWQVPPLSALIDNICAQYRVDPDRIYVTGLSMGGFASWELALEYPDRFAAVAPVCGRGDPRDAARVRRLPIWAFHGLADDTVPVAGTTDMIAAIRKAGGHPHMTLYPGVGHNSWDNAYATDALYTWLFAQKRGQPEVMTPGIPKP